MAHDLAITNGRTAMMYTGEAPWHRLGTRLDSPATAEEAITAAGLDYTVDLRPLMTSDGLSVPKRKATIRTDTNEPLGVVGAGYRPIQNCAHCRAFVFVAHERDQLAILAANSGYVARFNEDGFSLAPEFLDDLLVGVIDGGHAGYHFDGLSG